LGTPCGVNAKGVRCESHLREDGVWPAGRRDQRDLEDALAGTAVGIAIGVIVPRLIALA